MLQKVFDSLFMDVGRVVPTTNVVVPCPMCHYPMQQSSCCNHITKAQAQLVQFWRKFWSDTDNLSLPEQKEPPIQDVTWDTLGQSFDPWIRLVSKDLPSPTTTILCPNRRCRCLQPMTLVQSTDGYLYKCEGCRHFISNFQACLKNFFDKCFQPLVCTTTQMLEELETYELVSVAPTTAYTVEQKRVLLETFQRRVDHFTLVPNINLAQTTPVAQVLQSDLYLPLHCPFHQSSLHLMQLKSSKELCVKCKKCDFWVLATHLRRAFEYQLNAVPYFMFYVEEGKERQVEFERVHNPSTKIVQVDCFQRLVKKRKHEEEEEKQEEAVQKKQHVEDGSWCFKQEYLK